MNCNICVALLLIGTYFLGSVPFGWLIGKARGVDIRTMGSKNIGATNCFRCVGKKWGVLAFVLDTMKGLVPVLIARWLVTKCNCPEAAKYIAYLPIATGLTAVIGHMFTCFMKFKGGKGVATGFGMLIGLVPALSGAAFLLFVLCVLVTHYISVGSCVAAAFLGVAVWFRIPYVNECPPLHVACALVSLLAVFVVWKHRTNIRRLLNGNENKFW